VFNRGVKAVHDSIMAESQTQESETTGASDRRVCVCVCVCVRERCVRRALGAADFV